MKVLTSILLCVVVMIATTNLAECAEVSAGNEAGGSAGGEAGGSAGGEAGGGASGSISVSGDLSVSSVINKVVQVPVKLIKTMVKLGYTAAFKMPFKVVSMVAKGGVGVVKQAQGISSGVVVEVIALVKEVVTQVIDSMVQVGVLQGKTVEDVMTSVEAIIMKVISFGFENEAKISSTIVDSVQSIIKGINIPGIFKKLENTPLIKNFIKLVITVRMTIKNNFSTQISEIQTMIKTLINEHKDFFQPIFDSISSRILIITNSMQALISGDLKACSGETNPSTPTGSLQWQLMVWIDKIKVRIFTILGLKDLASKFEEELDDLKQSTMKPPSSGPTSLPPLMTTLGAKTQSPPMMTTMAPPDEGAPETESSDDSSMTTQSSGGESPGDMTTPPPGGELPGDMTTPPPGGESPGGMTTPPRSEESPGVMTSSSSGGESPETSPPGEGMEPGI